MGTRPKRTNRKYDPSGTPNPYPYGEGDRWYAQDIFRDLDFEEDEASRKILDLLQDPPFLLKGGKFSQGTGDSLDIDAAVGYMEVDVSVPDSYSGIPPTVQTVQRITRVYAPAQANMAIPGAVLDGSTVNYVKIKYAEVDGALRARAKKAGSWNYEVTPSFLYVVDPVAPTTEILLGTFVGSTGGPYSVSLANKSLTGLNENALDSRIRAEENAMILGWWFGA